MTVGRQLTNGNTDQIISDLSVQLRQVCTAISNLSKNVNGQGAGLATLEAAGYQPADAQTALNAIGQLENVAGLYFGTTTQPNAFSFDNALSQYWGGQ